MGAQWKAKHKDLAANAKGRLFGKLAKDIMIAARHGADPGANARLRLVMDQARKVSMPKVTLDRAIKKGAGLTGFLTDPGDLDMVRRALPAQGFTVLSAKPGYRPKNPVKPASLSAEQLEEVEAFLAALDANEDVQHVYG